MFEPTSRVMHTWYVPYKWSYGQRATEFLELMRKEQKIFFGRCTSCKKVIIPTAICGRCFAPLEDELVPLNDEGVLECFTVVYLPFPTQPAEPPYAYGYIRLDGSSSTMPHIIDEVDYDDLRVGMRVKAVWREELKGDIYDIKYFKPID